MPRVTPFTGLNVDSDARPSLYLCARAGICTPQREFDPADVVNFVAGVGDVLLGISSFGIVDGPEFRRVHDIGSVDGGSNAYEAGFWGTVFVSAGFGRLFAKPQTGTSPSGIVSLDSSRVAAAASTRSSGTALSEIRFTHPNEQFIRYESGNPAFSRVTPRGGVTRGTYAAPMSDGFVPERLRGSTYNLPNPEIPRTNQFILSPPPGTAIIGPRPVAGGTGQEVLFPEGF